LYFKPDEEAQNMFKI